MTVFLSLDCFASFPSFKSKKTTVGRACSHLGCGLSTPVVARPLVSAGRLASTTYFSDSQGSCSSVPPCRLQSCRNMNSTAHRGVMSRIQNVKTEEHSYTGFWNILQQPFIPWTPAPSFLIFSLATLSIRLCNIYLLPNAYQRLKWPERKCVQSITPTRFIFCLTEHGSVIVRKACIHHDIP